jgi:hypothetical protein
MKTRRSGADSVSGSSTIGKILTQAKRDINPLLKLD